MNSCTNEVYTPKNVTKKSHSYLTLARADNFSKLGELSLLEFQTKATCTLPVIVCEILSIRVSQAITHRQISTNRFCISRKKEEMCRMLKQPSTSPICSHKKRINIIPKYLYSLFSCVRNWHWKFTSYWISKLHNHHQN